MTGRRPAGLFLPESVSAIGRAAFFAGVPRFENRVGVLLGPVHAERAAVRQHHDQRLAGCGDRFEQVLFGLGQIEAGAVAALEAFFVDLHLFAFEFAGDADNGDDDVGVFRGFDGFGRGSQIDLRPDQLRSRRRCPATRRVFNFQCVGLACSRCTRPSLVSTPLVMKAIVRRLCRRADTRRSRSPREAEVVVAGFGRREGGFGADRDGFLACGLWRQWAGRERRCAGSMRVASGVGAGSGAASKTRRSCRHSVVRTPGLPSVVSSDGGTGAAFLAEELRACDVVDLRGGKLALRPSRTETVCVGVPL